MSQTCSTVNKGKHHECKYCSMIKGRWNGFFLCGCIIMCCICTTRGLLTYIIILVSLYSMCYIITNGSQIKTNTYIEVDNRRRDATRELNAKQTVRSAGYGNEVSFTCFNVHLKFVIFTKCFIHLCAVTLGCLLDFPSHGWNTH